MYVSITSEVFVGGCSMAERMLSGEIKEGDSAIIDVDMEGNVTVLNGKTGTNTATPIEAPAGVS